MTSRIEPRRHGGEARGTPTMLRHQFTTIVQYTLCNLYEKYMQGIIDVPRDSRKLTVSDQTSNY